MSCKYGSLLNQLVHDNDQDDNDKIMNLSYRLEQSYHLGRRVSTRRPFLENLLHNRK
jgi:hypothetical protein